MSVYKLYGANYLIRTFPITAQASACLGRLNAQHPAFKGCDMTSLEAVAGRIRANIKTVELSTNNGINLRNGTKDETPDEFIARGLRNIWRVVGHEYMLDELDYNISPDPQENTAGRNFGEWTYQFNRHEAWLVAALRYANAGHTTSHTRAIAALCSWIRTWVETCPAPTAEFPTDQTSWRTIEIGIRLGSIWLQVFTAIKDADTLDDELLLAWLNSVAEQCEYVWPNRTKNNWLLMEMNGLLTAGVIFPFFINAPEWKRNALNVFIEQIDGQFLQDGMQVELSASYHGVSFGQYLRVYALLQHVGEKIPPEFTGGMEQMLSAWRAMVRPNGQIFCFQDSNPVDYGKQLPRMPDIIKSPEDAFFTTANSPPPGHLNDFLPYAGYGALRTGWTEKDTAVAIDVGPIGAGHQHEDKLSVQIWSRGQDLLGEAGLVDYAGSSQRAYSLTTLAHSTAIVDGQQQNRMRLFKAGKLKYLPNGKADATYVNNATPSIKGVYQDGYGAKNEIEVVHERTVVLNSADLITITDSFRAQDGVAHKIEILFHLLKDGFTIEKNKCSSTGKGPNIVLSCSRADAKALTVTGVSGGGDRGDLRGWAAMNPADFQGTYVLVPRPCITIAADMTDEVEIVTEITIVD